MAYRFPQKIENKLGDQNDKTILLNLVIAKYRDLSVSQRSACH